jgi:inner membrane protein
VDTLTHALSGALLARATAPKHAAPRAIPRRMAAGFFACAAPDLDFVVSFAGPMDYLLHHRGVTHSILLLPLWAFVVAWVLAKVLRAPGGWRELYGVSALGIGAHIAGDVITSFGTIVFAPLSLWRAGIGTTFIIDLWFTGVILAGLVASSVVRRSRAPAVLASLVLAGYVGFQYVQKEKALDFGRQYAAERGLSGARVEAHPRPVSPFNWTVFVSDDEVHRFAHINLVRDTVKSYREGDGFIARIDAPYRPPAQALWDTRPRYGDAQSREAWNAEALRVFRWFADQPAFDGQAGGCYFFTDLRFLAPGRGDTPFRYGVCRESGTWRLEGRI